MEQEAVEHTHGADTGATAAPGAQPVSATEQLAQLTLDALPEYMKAPGGIARFQSWMAIAIILVVTAFGIAFYRLG